jgi:outer membrane lipoprotein-sorting protein
MKYWIILIGLMLNVAIMAQNKAQKAKTLLDEVSAKTKAAKSIKADFTYTMENTKARLHEEKSGSVLISGDKYKMTASGQTIICDGKTIWTYIKESNEVQVNAVDGNQDAITPTTLLTTYGDNFNAKMVKSEDASLEMVELTPKKVKNITKVVLRIKKAAKQVDGFSIYDKGGSVFNYRIKNYSTDQAVNSSDFTFDVKKFPGVEVIDMR